MLEREKQKRKKRKEKGKSKKPIKIGFFKVVIQKCEKSKKDFFFRKLADTICVRKGEKRAFSMQLSVLAKIFFGPEQCKARNTVK